MPESRSDGVPRPCVVTPPESEKEGSSSGQDTGTVPYRAIRALGRLGTFTLARVRERPGAYPEPVITHFTNMPTQR